MDLLITKSSEELFVHQDNYSKVRDITASSTIGWSLPILKDYRTLLDTVLVHVAPGCYIIDSLTQCPHVFTYSKNV